MSTSLPSRSVRVLHEDEHIEPGQRIFANNFAADNGPVYSVAGAAKFFNWSPNYMRRLEDEGVFELDRKKGERREFTLADIENISYAVRDADLIYYERHKAIVNAVLNIARVWGIA